MNSPILKEWMGPTTAQARPLFRFFLGSSTAHTTIQRLIALASSFPLPSARSLLLDLLIWLESYAYKAQIARTMREVDEQSEVIGGLIFADTWNQAIQARVQELREENPQARLSVIRVPMEPSSHAEKHQAPEISFASSNGGQAETRFAYTVGAPGRINSDADVPEGFLTYLANQSGIPAILVEAPSNGSKAQNALGGEIRITAPFTYITPGYQIVHSEPKNGDGVYSTNGVPNFILNRVSELLNNDYCDDDDDDDDDYNDDPGATKRFSLGPLQKLKKQCFDLSESFD